MPTGYTLPVFACASAIAALKHLQQQPTSNKVTVNLIKPDQQVEIEIEQVAKIADDSAIAITRTDSGAHLDLTHNTPVWAKVKFQSEAKSQVTLIGGEGIGRLQSQSNQAAIYSYAQELITVNLQRFLTLEQNIVVQIILPEGKKLAKRTSNEAFGVVEGLSLLGTTGIVQPLTAPSQLNAYQAQIIAKAKTYNTLVFCIGENGIDLAQKSGIDPARIIKTANWLGSMLVTAASTGIQSILLFGYHGKLIKLAGGIFHTHNHLADGRLEIMTAYCAKLGLPGDLLKQIFACATTESALNLLREFDTDSANNTNFREQVYRELARAIDTKCQNYIYKYTEQKLCVGSVLFDRQRNTIQRSENALLLLPELC